MKQPLTTLLAIAVAAVTLVSCGEKAPKAKRKKDGAPKNFFVGIKPSITVDSLKNQMNDGETDFLRSFADHSIPWQKWSPEVLEIATKAQLPVFALVGSSLGQASPQVAREIDQNEKLRKSVADSAICTVIDTHLNPEMGQLSFYLSTEINRSTAFPMAIWLSHEGAPLAWLPVGQVTGKELEKVILNASSMVNDIWGDTSKYAVENSRRDNIARQLRFDSPSENTENAPEIERSELFRRSTRQLSSLYSTGDKDIDHIGGLLPTSTLQLLAMGSRSHLFTDEVRQRCHLAATEVGKQLMTGALRDPLDQSYFYARRTSDWSVPSFSKNIESQARVASLFMNIGTTLQNEQFVSEGLSLLERIETDWLARGLSTTSSTVDHESPDTFLWSFEALKELLSEEQLRLATTAFSLKENGNIPTEVDPLGRYHKLNSLRNQVTAAQIAGLFKITEEDITARLKVIRAILLKNRDEKGQLFTESTITLSDLIVILKAQIERSSLSEGKDDLQTALATATRISSTYWNLETGLTRFKSKDKSIPARGGDYAATGFVFTLLYQRTLDPKWLTLSCQIFDHALEHLRSENGVLSELGEDEKVIPLRLHNVSMIFGTSTLGFADLTASRLFALTGNPAYLSLLEKHNEIVFPRVTRSVVNHTDYLISAALGDVPLIAVVQGDTNSPSARKFLAELNQSPNLPFIVIRPQNTPAEFAPLPDLPDLKGESSVVLIQGDLIIGQAESLPALSALLSQTISIRK